EKFASYAFNKSHATCYSWLAYQTAYLKANYPVEYMAATMSRSLSDISDITKLMDECKIMGIKVFGPDVNESNLKFTVTKQGNIRFGLGAVKGVGGNCVQSIMEEREKEGLYKGIFDFIQRVNLNACNRKSLESLALAGAFDSFPELKREQYFATNAKGEAFLDTLIRYGMRYQADKVMASHSLFGGENMVQVATPEILPAKRWSDLERLNQERELVGIYLSAHPLDEYAVILENVCNTHMAELEDKAKLSGRDITMGGIVTGVRRGVSKSGNPYGIAKIEDYSGWGEIPFWGSDWVNYQGYLNEGTLLYIKATCGPRFRQVKPDDPVLKITSIELLPDVKDKLIEKITILVPLPRLDTALINDLAMMSQKHPGNASLVFKVVDPESDISLDLVSRPVKVSVGRELITFIKESPGLDYRIN
ncbi:MAG: DNA polymerase III subunit alpha, partial [Prevotellaceae bacterium]|nr:DNA polymerase III subunit alpha [Prevotellaceae bacterium]